MTLEEAVSPSPVRRPLQVSCISLAEGATDLKSLLDVHLPASGIFHGDLQRDPRLVEDMGAHLVDAEVAEGADFELLLQRVRGSVFLIKIQD